MSAVWGVALICALGGLLVAPLVRRIPEPEPEPDPESAAGESGEPGHPAEPAKELYRDIGSRRGLPALAVLLSAGAGGVLGWCLGWSWSQLFLVPLVPVLVALAVVDWRTRLLPTWLIARTYAALVPLVLLVGVVTQEWDDVIRAGWGWLITGALYFVLWFVNSSGLGYGDVRLSGVLGMALGHLGWGELFAGVYAAFILGGVVGGVLALAKVVDRRGVPFGPFMVAGALVGVLLGPWTAGRFG
ncbi:prepilin peptidase [Nocardioides sp. Y6]|uniref:Prepilin peptidase n=1 Tax=Nocardioides malaquae TaxID=2773426 RepID=A0ABR9RSH3_9ACTN|nr:A24 family peptidase [Nocardioides malaquae]MBE7324335.1 prepilin peptidase [Nocardioides malaquae]